MFLVQLLDQFTVVHHHLKGSFCPPFKMLPEGSNRAGVMEQVVGCVGGKIKDDPHGCGSDAFNILPMTICCVAESHRCVVEN
jgi:hypothetical protein